MEEIMKMSKQARCALHTGNKTVGIAHPTFFVCLMIVLYSTTSCIANNNHSMLKDVFSRDFLIGAALNDAVVSGKDPNAAAIVQTHFSSITAENTMKWASIHPEPNRYDFAAADRFVAFGQKNKMFIVGHTLVWHHQTPTWVFKDANGSDIDREVLLERMKDHIFTVVGRYKGKVKGWDVVNEALTEDGQLRKTRWLGIIGEDFIAKAFEYAHQADPNAELYYNDFSLDTDKEKCDGAVALVKNLKSKGLRIDGVGIQMHSGLDYPDKESLEYGITALAATGVKVMITELDIRTRTWGYRGADISRINRQSTTDSGAADDETQQKLAQKYAELFSVFLKHKNDIYRVTFWGVYDATSWIGGSPLLFDRNYQPKPAFFAVVKTAK
jgi:endo-1,4-beta-xylanase